MHSLKNYSDIYFLFLEEYLWYLITKLIIITPIVTNLLGSVLNILSYFISFKIQKKKASWVA